MPPECPCGWVARESRAAEAHAPATAAAVHRSRLPNPYIRHAARTARRLTRRVRAARETARPLAAPRDFLNEAGSHVGRVSDLCALAPRARRHPRARSPSRLFRAQGGCTVLVLAAADVDALAACKILTYLLRNDHIAYQIKPVFGYGDVASAAAQLASESSEIRNVVMLNCGAIVDVEAMLGLEAARCRALVLDSHRPIHLANVYRSRDVYVFDDGLAAADVVGKGAERMPADGEGLDGGDDDDTSDEDARRRAAGEGGDDDESDENEFDDDEAADGADGADDDDAAEDGAADDDAADGAMRDGTDAAAAAVADGDAGDDGDDEEDDDEDDDDDEEDEEDED